MDVDEILDKRPLANPSAEAFGDRNMQADGTFSKDPDDPDFDPAVDGHGVQIVDEPGALDVSGGGSAAASGEPVQAPVPEGRALRDGLFPSEHEAGFSDAEERVEPVLGDDNSVPAEPSAPP